MNATSDPNTRGSMTLANTRMKFAPIFIVSILPNHSLVRTGPRRFIERVGVMRDRLSESLAEWLALE